MQTLFFLLLPVAAFSGWYVASYKAKKNIKMASGVHIEYFTGLNYLINEQPDKAVDVFLEMLNLDDELFETHLTLGSLFRRRGEVDRAIRIHQGLIARPCLTPSQRSFALLELSRDYISAGVLDRAENLLLELIELDEQLEASLHHLLSIYQKEKEWKKAIEIAQKIQSLSGTGLSVAISHFYCELAQGDWKKGSVQSVRFYLKKALQENRFCVRANFLLGDLDASLGNYSTAIKYYKHIAIQEPIFVLEMLPKLLHCYEKEGTPKEIVAFLKLCLQNPKTRMVLLSDPAWFSRHAISEINLPNLLLEHMHETPSIKGMKELLQIQIKNTTGQLREELSFIEKLATCLIETQAAYRCEGCGFSARILKWLCPGCHAWGKIKPELGG